MADGLRGLGFSAPEIIARDTERGFLLVEDFGKETMLIAGLHVPERMSAATDLLVSLHAMELPRELPGDAGPYRIPQYDLDAMLIECELLVDWYLPHRGRPASAAGREDFLALWRSALRPILDGPQTWTLRDYHSPNLMWLGSREGLFRVGLLDFQDAVLGHPAYDAVSLMQDARVDMPGPLELSLLNRYIEGRRAQGGRFDPEHFAQAYAVLGAQRATKILGIFVRLAVRDQKQVYLKHLPRLLRYLDRDLSHPSLSELRRWYIAALGVNDKGRRP